MKIIIQLQQDAELAAAFALAKFHFGDVISSRIWAARSEHYWRSSARQE
jgi:alpha/beta superfamily hydrolase